MKILQKREEAYVPVNQPTNQPANFPAFYTIPDTRYVRRRDRAANHPCYRQITNPTKINPTPHKASRFVGRMKQRIHQYLADAWSRLKQWGRQAAKWVAWRIVLPLSVACALWIPYVKPAELPY